MTKHDLSIAMNGSMLDEQPTGVGVYSFNLINHLFCLYEKDSGKTMTVFTPTQTLLNKDLKVVKLSALLQSSKYGKVAALCRFLWNTFSYPFQARGYDLLISPTTHGSFLLKNQVITIHDLLSLRYKHISAHQRLYFKYLLPLLVSRAELILTVSETTRQDIIRFLKCPEEKVKVVYNGYDESSYYQQAEKDDVIYREYGFKDYLLAVGPTYPHKNLEMLLLAYHELRPAIRSRHPLVIAGGKKEYTNYLKRRAKELHLGTDVYFTGYIPMRLMPSLYREAHALIFPSLYEGFGIPLLEAMACGCPVAVSSTSSMPEVCGEAALYFDPANKNAIRAAIEQLIFDETTCCRLREKGLIQVQKFSWERTARKIKTLLDNHFSIN
jgi:glycosyltransferase involved in cell wall biosynthesis